MGAASDSVIDEYMQEENMISPFNIEIAGKSVRIEPMYGCIHEYCRGFVTDKEADTIVSISQAEKSLTCHHRYESLFCFCTM